MPRPLILPLLCTLLAAGCVTRAPNLERGMRVTAEGRASEPQVPLSQPSDEATLQHLQLAREQGQAVQDAVDYLRRHAASGQMFAGPYEVTWLLSAPEGWYAPEDGQLRWHPGQGAAHLSVVVRDGYDGRTVPGLKVTARLLDGSGRTVHESRLPAGHYPLLDRYGENLPLGGAGPYTLRLQIDPPSFPRHDPVNGDRYADPATAVFTRLQVPQGAPSLVQAETTPEANELARQLGASIQQALATMLGKVAMDGAETRKGEYLVDYAVEYAEGLWQMKDGKLRYDTKVEQSAEQNAHVEVALRDPQTGRMLMGVPVHATLYRDGRTTGSHEVGFIWHPWLYHYGRNWRVPETGNYRLRVQADIPPWRRYGREAGRRFTQPVEVEFDDVNVQTGQK